MLPTQAAAKEACRSSSKRMHRRFQIRSGPRKAGETGSVSLGQARVPAAAQGLNQESAPGNTIQRGGQSALPSLPLVLLIIDVFSTPFRVVKLAVGGWLVVGSRFVVCRAHHVGKTSRGYLLARSKPTIQ